MLRITTPSFPGAEIPQPVAEGHQEFYEFDGPEDVIERRMASADFLKGLVKSVLAGKGEKSSECKYYTYGLFSRAVTIYDKS